jgi:hypothetical protein
MNIVFFFFFYIGLNMGYQKWWDFFNCFIMVDPELSQEFKVGVKLNKQPKVDKKPSKVG